MFEAILFIQLCAMWNGEKICTDRHADTYSTPTQCKEAAEFYNEEAGIDIFQCKSRKLEKVKI